LRQFTVRLSQTASFSLPVDNTAPSQANRRAFLIAIPNEGVPDLQQLSRDAIGIKPDPAGARRDTRVLFRFQSDLSSRPPAYILQSVLNLWSPRHLVYPKHKNPAALQMQPPLIFGTSVLLSSSMDK